MTTTSKTSDFRIGCHLSASEGYLSMAKTAVQIGANTFQFFTRNPRGGTAKPIDPEDVSAFLEYSEQNDIGPILALLIPRAVREVRHPVLRELPV